MSEINYGKAISLFLISAVAFEYSRKRREGKNTAKECLSVTHKDKISSRGASQLNPILPYLGSFFQCLAVSPHFLIPTQMFLLQNICRKYLLWFESV